MSTDGVKDIASDARAERGQAWAEAELGCGGLVREPVAGDASFRRYFRLREADGPGDRSWVLMDAPPDRENSQPFLEVDRRLRKAGLAAPEIVAEDLPEGYLLLEDFGDTLLREVLDERSVDAWFPRLFDLLERMATAVDPQGLPPYDRGRLLTELELFPRWYLNTHRGIQLGCTDWDLWEALCARLIGSALEQPQVFVHRDFHSCNLLAVPGGSHEGGRIGIIDFQDAVRGPLTYDFASLVWDRYIAWPRDRLEHWMEEFRTRVAPDTDPGTWKRWCDWMGLQRNLKIVGIFARLHHRDGKAGYLEMIPRFWGYLRDVLPRYPEFEAFDELLARIETERD